MPYGTPRSDEERRARHRELYGTEEVPERRREGPKYDNPLEVLWDMLPAFPFEFGPMTLPLPRGIMRDLSRRK
ncbi:MAG: hypothetical protein ACTSUO_00130 [Candidatus Thorarchaeota archaeon]